MPVYFKYSLTIHDYLFLFQEKESVVFQIFPIFSFSISEQRGGSTYMMLKQKGQDPNYAKNEEVQS